MKEKVNKLYVIKGIILFEIIIFFLKWKYEILMCIFLRV